MTTSSFTGPIAEYYAEFRRGYPPPVIDRLMAALDLDDRSRVLDLGCGTGQLTVPLAACTRSVLGVDIEADMLRLARRAGQDAGADNITWMLGADSDLGALAPWVGEHVLDAVTIGQAPHWMDPPRLFRALRRLVRPGGGVAVITNGTPQWLQDVPWSRALRRHLEAWLGIQLTARCGTDPSSRRAYREALIAAGFDQIIDAAVTYREDLTFAQLVGSVYSAMPLDQLPQPDEREAFEQQLRDALGASTFAEHVPVTLLVGRRGT
ncbi:class I SAM-dependent methyltransferase [Pseudonocardia nigra]|uniref:class I SAM-dependent methyltransferase n=1 Tax=Pseudonocardia nigra TaxID=1921578 RepID=UPI001C5F9726|nr:class I SAM-dependent methyltransferase [Pseudonocardia nigra]